MHLFYRRKLPDFLQSYSYPTWLGDSDQFLVPGVIDLIVTIFFAIVV